MSLTNDDINKLRALIAEVFIPMLEKKIEKDIQGAVHAEAMKLLYDLGTDEIKTMIQKLIKSRLSVEVKLNEVS